MAQSNDFLHRIHKIKWYTICIRSYKTDSRHVRNHSVCLRKGLSPLPGVHALYIRRMCLLRVSKICHFYADCLRNQFTILFHRLRIISSCQADVHRTEAPGTDSTQSGRKSVIDDSCIFKKRIGQIRHTAALPLCKYLLIILIF